MFSAFITLSVTFVFFPFTQTIFLRHFRLAYSDRCGVAEGLSNRAANGFGDADNVAILAVDILIIPLAPMLRLLTD